MGSESVDLVIKIAGTLTLTVLSFVLGLLAFAYQKRTKAIDDTIRTVNALEVQVSDLSRLGIAAQLARHTTEIAALSGQLDDLSVAVSDVAKSTAQIDRSLAILAADAGHNRATMDRMDRHISDLLSRNGHTSAPPAAGN